MLEQLNEQVDIAANVFAQRYTRGWNQSELARRAGVSRSTLNNLETYRKTPSMVTLRKLALAFGVPLAELLSEGRPSITVDGEERKLGKVLPPRGDARNGASNGGIP